MRITRLFGILLAACLVTACQQIDPPWNLLVITLDTTRADALGCYGHPTARTPNLDRLAQEGVLFEHCFTPVPITTPSHSTIFTGTYPMAHGVRDNGLFVLPDRAHTLAEVLTGQGWATGAAVGSFPVTRQFGLDQGFTYFNDHITLAAEDYRGDRVIPSRGLFFDERPAAWVNDAIAPWLNENTSGPFFAWVHYWDAHHPHQPPAPFNQIFAHDLYEGEIAYVDQSLGTLINLLEKRGVWDRTIVVVVGDHGEGNGEHNEDTHSLLAYNATLHIPLIIRVPGLPPGVRIEQRVGTVDIMPTILDLLGIDAPEGLQGRSLAGLMGVEGKQTEDQDLYYAETLSPRLSHGWGELRALYDGRFKYIHGPRPELYDLEADPGELVDLVDRLPEERDRMRTELARFITDRASTGAAAAAHTPDDETLQRLAALGYLSTEADEPATVLEELRSDGTPPQDRIGDNSLMSNARQQINKREFLAARESALRLVELDPDNVNYQGILALAALGLGQVEESARIVDGMKTISPQHAGSALQVALELFERGHAERGLQLAQRINNSQPSAWGCYVLAEMHGRLGDQTRQQQELEQALELDAEYPRARLSLAILLARHGDGQRADEEFRKLIADYPLYPKAQFNFGLFLAQAGRSDEALVQLERAVQLSPTYWQAQLTLLAVNVDLGREEQAGAIADRIRTQARDPRIGMRVEELMTMLGAST